MALGNGPLGVALMMGSNVVDLAGIGVDYLWKRSQQADAEPPQADAPAPEPAPQAAAGPERAPASLVQLAE